MFIILESASTHLSDLCSIIYHIERDQQTKHSKLQSDCTHVFQIANTKTKELVTSKYVRFNASTCICSFLKNALFMLIEVYFIKKKTKTEAWLLGKVFAWCWSKERQRGRSIKNASYLLRWHWLIQHNGQSRTLSPWHTAILLSYLISVLLSSPGSPCLSLWPAMLHLYSGSQIHVGSSLSIISCQVQEASCPASHQTFQCWAPIGSVSAVVVAAAPAVVFLSQTRQAAPGS